MKQERSKYTIKQAKIPEFKWQMNNVTHVHPSVGLSHDIKNNDIVSDDEEVASDVPRGTCFFFDTQ